MTSREIAQSLVDAVERDNGYGIIPGVAKGDMLKRLKPAKRTELFESLVDGVESMMASGCLFSEDDIDLMAMGDQDEAEERFSGFVGYAETNKALNGIFDPEREWCN